MTSVSNRAGAGPFPTPIVAEPAAVRLGTRADRPRIAIFIVAYNAVTTLAKVLDRIPDAVREVVEEVYVFDDASQDDTYILGRGYQEVHAWAKLKVFRNDVNLGYGGNQKLGYRYAIERGFDVVVLLHGDGQYAPEALPRVLAPLVEGKADAVLGSRMLERGAARRGGMPLYKLAGNRILTRYQNWLTGARLSEWHSGYRAYRVRALEQLPLSHDTDDFHFDTEIILQLMDHGFRVAEVPIPVYYGDEVCYVNGLRYARDVFRTTLEHKLHEIGYRSDPRFRVAGRERGYRRKEGKHSSHSVIARLVPSGSRVLDVGCEPEAVEELAQRGCDVTGVNDHLPRGAEYLTEFHVKDLEQGLDLPGHEGRYDVVLLADVIEHLRTGDALLARLTRFLRPGGLLIVSTANVAFWFIRLQLMFGRFSYGRKGILDETHVKLYTLRSFLDAIRGADLSVLSVRPTPPPFEAIFPAYAESRWIAALNGICYAFARLRKELFAYQFVIEARPRTDPERS